MTQKRNRHLNPRFVALCTAVAVMAVLVVIAAVWRFSGSGEPVLPGTDVTPPDYVTEELLTVNGWSRPGTPLQTIDGVVIHYVGNPGTSAEANRNYFENLSSGEEETYASAHFIVGLEGEVIQCVPLTEWAYASNSRNEDTVSVEVCHPDETGVFGLEAYDRTVELTAWLCGTFKLDPAVQVIRHYDVTGKNCPRYYVEHEEAWAEFLTDVADALAKAAAEKSGGR